MGVVGSEEVCNILLIYVKSIEKQDQEYCVTKLKWIKADSFFHLKIIVAMEIGQKIMFP